MSVRRRLGNPSRVVILARDAVVSEAVRTGLREQTEPMRASADLDQMLGLHHVRAAARSTVSPRTREGGSFPWLIASLGGMAAFFLIRPLFSHGAYYGPRSGTGYAYWYLVGIAFIPYAFALRAYRRGFRPTNRALFAAACVLYVALILAPAQQSQDIYQSLLYGKMALHGHNPYLVHAASLPDPWRAWTRWNNTLSVYGPIWTTLNVGIVTAAAGNLTAAFLIAKAIAAGCALSATWALARAARAPKKGEEPGGVRSDSGFVVLAFAFNPLVVSTVGIGAHPDIAVAVAIAGAVLSERRGRYWATTLLVAVAALVKVYAAVVLVAWLLCLARRRGGRPAIAHAVSAAALAACCYVPFWGGLSTFQGWRSMGRSASASLAGTVVRFASGHPTDALAAGSSPTSSAVRGTAAVLLCLVAVGVARSARTGTEPWRAAALLFGAYLLFTPWYLPWDITGLLALAVVGSDEVVTWSTVVFSASSLVVGGGLVAQTIVRYGPPLAIANWAKRRTAPAVTQAVPAGLSEEGQSVRATSYADSTPQAGSASRRRLRAWP